MSRKGIAFQDQEKRIVQSETEWVPKVLVPNDGVADIQSTIDDGEHLDPTTTDSLHTVPVANPPANIVLPRGIDPHQRQILEAGCSDLEDNSSPESSHNPLSEGHPLNVPNQSPTDRTALNENLEEFQQVRRRGKQRARGKQFTEHHQDRPE
ncbi:hypothetical protein Dimus_002953 [Dionaea muscipula]